VAFGRIRDAFSVVIYIIYSLTQDIVMSDSEDSTVTCIEVSSLFEDMSDIRSPRVDGLPMMLEDPYAYVEAALQAPLSLDYDDIIPAEEQPQPAAVSPTVDSPGYIPEEDDDEEEDPSRDDADDKEETKTRMRRRRRRSTQLRSTLSHYHQYTSFNDPIESRVTIYFPSTTTYYTSIYKGIYGHDESYCTIHLHLSTLIRDITISYILPRKRLCIALGPRFEVEESSSASTAMPTGCFRADYHFVGTLDVEIRRDPDREIGYGITDVWEDPDEIAGEIPMTDVAELGQRMKDFVMIFNMLRKDRHSHARTTRIMESEARISCEDWVQSMDASNTTRAEVMSLHTIVSAHQKEIAGLQKMATKRTTRSTPATTTTTTTPVTNAQLKALIYQGVVDVLATRDADRSRNGEDSHDSGTGVRRKALPSRKCTYQDFLKCKPLYFKGTEGVVKLTQWFKRMETVFRISNCTMEKQVKFATCTLLGGALMWGEIKKLEVEMWNLMVKGTDVESVMAFKPRTMHDTIEFTTKLMDKKISTFAERHAKSKRKFEDTSKNNQNHQQDKKQNIGRAYTVGSGEKKPYGGSKPLCSKCNYHHDGQKPTFFKCGAQGHFKRECPKLKNNNRGNPTGNGNAPAKLYAVGHARTNPYSNVITGFSKISMSMTKLTQKGVRFDWGDKEEAAFQLIKQKLFSTSILALREGSGDFVVYCDASHKGLGDVLMQREKEKYAKLEAERYEYMIRYSAYFDNDKQHRKWIADQQVLYDKMSVQLVELDKHTVHMIMPSKDNLYNVRKRIDFENPRYFEKAKDLRPTLYDEKVIGLGYTPMFLTHSDEALEIEKFKRSRENKIEFAYDYGNPNASYVNGKINLEDDYVRNKCNVIVATGRIVNPGKSQIVGPG
nr:reverse transcriptase domain-containing protein [Tanacetum cinerariifolium]